MAAIAPLFLSWLFIAGGPWIGAIIPWRPDYEPVLPSVGVIPWERVSDNMSSIPGLFQVLIVAGLGALIVEISKLTLPQGSTASYLLLLAYQLTLVADALRSYSFDWWVWLTYWLGLRAVAPERIAPGYGFPWISLVAMLAVAIYLSWRLRPFRGVEQHN